MTNGRVRDQIALVTGAGSGIGRATAILLAEEGAVVIVADINAAAADKVVAELFQRGGKAEAAALDVADASAWTRVIETILTRHQRLDVLVNNAGISFAKPIADTSLAEWRQVLAVNLDGVFLGTKYAINAMKPRKSGSIINVASVSGINAFAGASAYGASKAAIRHFSRVAAIECADAQTGVRVNVVSPSGVKTPMWEGVDFFRDLVAQHGGTEEAFTAMAGTAASQRFFSAEEIARTILYLASDESSHLSGVEMVIAQGHAG